VVWVFVGSGWGGVCVGRTALVWLWPGDEDFVSKAKFDNSPVNRGSAVTGGRRETVVVRVNIKRANLRAWKRWSLMREIYECFSF
jgi:hypothetical protein